MTDGMHKRWKATKLGIMMMMVVNANIATELQTCCKQNSLPSECSKSCFNVVQSQRGNYQSLTSTCPLAFVRFWSCVQTFLTDTNSNISLPQPQPPPPPSSSPQLFFSSSEWWGRSCCELSLTSFCKNACLKAKSDYEIEAQCSRGDGTAVYNCLEKHREGQKCCQSSGTDQCHSSCKALFIQDTPPGLSQLQAAINLCNAPVVDCIRKRFQTTPSDLPPHNIECCDHGMNDSCSKECKEVLNSDVSEEETVEHLTKSCGSPNPGDPMWQCFLRGSSSDSRHRGGGGGGGRVVAVGGMDAVKFQCCHRAIKNKCKNLCEKTFSKGWSDTISEFHKHCSSNLQERSLNNCLEDAEDRCQFGCSNLTYCSNFNYRPTEMFRKCGPGPDAEAQRTFQSWRGGYISLPDVLTFDVPVKDITKCFPEKWRVIACVLHIRPCKGGEGSWICKKDCIDILTACLDRKKMAASTSIKEMCDFFSPTDNPDECISLDSYLIEGRHKASHQDVTTPCNPNPCGSKEVCLVARQPCYQGEVTKEYKSNKGGYQKSYENSNWVFKTSHYDNQNGGEDDDDDYDSEDDVCPSHFCKPGCPMGEMMTQLAVPGSLVHLQDPANQACFQLCRCGYYGSWVNCTKTCADGVQQQKQCLLTSGMIHEHGTVFNIGCNTCVCYNRETVCTSKYCRSLPFQPSPPFVTYVAPSIPSVTGLPCNCSTNYKAVCADSGQTFPNLCLARCHKFDVSQLKSSSCQAIDPCAKNPCPSGERCIKVPRVCIGGYLLPQNLCLQYQCVKLATCNQKTASSSSFCDVGQSRDYSSLCEAAFSNSSVVCEKYCSVGCNKKTRVCGVDGVTYRSECHAKCHNMPVDYHSPCSTSPHLINMTSSKLICPGITCPKRRFAPGCRPVIPPGACCPICAGEIRCLVSQRQAIAISHQLGAITMSGLVNVLESLLSVKECRIEAYMSMEAELVLLVIPAVQPPSSVQMEACMKEASHLSTLISTRSPTITSYAHTSILLTAELKNSKTSVLPYSSKTKSTYMSPSSSLYGVMITTIILTAFLRCL